MLKIRDKAYVDLCYDSVDTESSELDSMIASIRNSQCAVHYVFRLS